MKPSASLDNWREYFRGGDSDIFEIIHHAIMVAAKDRPKEFKSRKGEIAELLFSSGVSRCIVCDHLEVSIAGEEAANHGLQTKETVGVSHRDDSGIATEDDKKSKKNRTYGEAETLSDSSEVMRIRDILFNKEHEPDSVLLKSLRKLESMFMTVDILKETHIGKAVNGLRKHSSEKISKLAKTLFVEWKELFERWMKTPKETTSGAKGTPESVNLSILDGLGCNGSENLVEEQNKNQHKRREEAKIRPMRLSATDFDDPRTQPKQMVLADLRKLPAVTEQKRKPTEPQQDKLKPMDPETKFGIAKRKLHESYHDNSKKRRKIQVLDTIPHQSKIQKPQFKRPSRR